MEDKRPIELDLRGLKCPMPVLRTRKAMRRLSVGQVLLVLCTDPLATIDIPHLAREDGHTLVSIDTGGDVAGFTLVKNRD